MGDVAYQNAYDIKRYIETYQKRSPSGSSGRSALDTPKRYVAPKNEDNWFTAELKKQLPWWGAGLAAVLLMMVLGLYDPYESSSSGSYGDIGAQVAARGFVRNRMNNPSSAKFLNEMATKIPGTSTWQVSGMVRGTNTFDGVVTQSYSIKVEKRDGDWYGGVPVIY